MKQLTDNDIANMIDNSFSPDSKTAKSVRRELHLSKRIPVPNAIPTHIVVDFHQHTEQEAWNMVMHAAQSGAKTATIITGASGILKVKFQQWVHDSLLSPYIVQCTPVNNGSFDVKFKKH